MALRCALIRRCETLSAEPVAPSQTPIFIPSELIIPYDRLGRDNVTIRAQQNGGGSDADYSTVADDRGGRFSSVLRR
jgi:hypothetical protein